MPSPQNLYMNTKPTKKKDTHRRDKENENDDDEDVDIVQDAGDGDES